jgi:hypothetical protein
MEIVIPTRGRLDHQYTLADLSPKQLARMTLVCPVDEVSGHQRRHPEVAVLPQPDHIQTISEKRAWIVKEWSRYGAEKIVMLDDDLRFYVRREDVPDRLRYCTAEDIDYWFDELETRLTSDVPHAGFGPRQGNNNQEPGWQTPGRMMLCLGYHLPTVVKHAEFGRVKFREDMDVTLQLLRAGLPNAVCHTMVVGQASGYAAKGGCTDERDVEGSNTEADRLAKLHPGYVRVVEKPYKSSIPRREVICSWAKALRDGQQRRRDQASSPQTG